MKKITSKKLKAGYRFYIPFIDTYSSIEILFDSSLKRFLVYYNGGTLTACERHIKYLKIALSNMNIDFNKMSESFGAR